MTIAPGNTILASDILGLAVNAGAVANSGTMTISLTNGTVVTVAAPGPILTGSIASGKLTGGGNTASQQIPITVGTGLVLANGNTLQASGAFATSAVGLGFDTSVAGTISSQWQAGDVLTIGANLVLSNGTISATGGGGGSTTVASGTGINVVTSGTTATVNLAALGAAGLLGASSAAVPSTISIGGGLTLSGSSLTATWQGGAVTTLGSGLVLSGGTLTSTGGGGNWSAAAVTSIDTTLVNTSGVLAVDPTLALTSLTTTGTIQAGTTLSVTNGLSLAGTALSGPPATGNMIINFNGPSNTSNLLLIRNTASILAEFSASGFNPNSPIFYSYNPVLGATYGISGAMFQQSSTWTMSGSVVAAASGIWANNIAHTFNISNSTTAQAVGVLQAAASYGSLQTSLMTGVRFTATLAATPADTLPHDMVCLDLEPTISTAVSMNGANNIGMQVRMANGAGVTNISTHAGLFIKSWVQSASALGNYGLVIQNLDTANRGTSDDAAIALVSAAANSAFTTGLLIGSNSTQYTSPGVLTTGTLIQTGSHQTAAAKGVDFTNTTFTSSAWVSTGHTISPTGVNTSASFVVGASGPTLTSGAAAPSGTQPAGSMYFRTAGSVGAQVYVSAGGGTWNPIAGV